MTLLQIVVAVMIRLPALYIAMAREGPVEKGTMILLAMFSALLGFLMPATGFLNIGGVLFRLALFCVIVMITLRIEPMEAFGIVVVAAIIESLIILALMISPASWLVAGMSPLSIP